MWGNPLSTHHLTLHSSSCSSRQKFSDRNSKERIRGRKEQTEMEEKDAMFHICVL